MVRVGNERALRIGTWVVLALASVISLLCVTLVGGAMANDRSISSHLGTANALVERVTFDRTIIRFDTPDGISHSPANGVLYPTGLQAGQLVRIEYDTSNPELAKVAGRTWVLSLLPAGSTLLITWAVAAPLLWWLRRLRRRAAAAADATG